MKVIKIISINLLFLLIFSTSVFSFPWQKHEKILTAENILSLIKDNNQSIIYAASDSSVYKSNNNGDSWKKIFNIRKANKEINRLYLNSKRESIIYVLTQDGVYQSNDEGKNWHRVFKGNSDLENNCLSMIKTDKATFLGTEEGLFISYNQDRSWQKSFENFSNSVISSMVSNPQNEDIIYVACERGVFISEDSGKNWKRIYVVYSSEIPDEDYSDYDREISDKAISIRSMTISNKEPNRLYIATTKGLFLTENKGEKWQSLTKLGLPSLNIRSMVVSKDSKRLFVATDKGIFKLSDKKWKQIGRDLSNKDFNDLSIDEDGLLWMAGRGGVFKLCIEKDILETNTQACTINLSKEDIENLFAGESTIEQVQRAAIEYSETNINKIYSWRRQSRLKALFPTFSVGYDKSVYGSSSGAMAVGSRDWNLDLSWDVADLIWSTDQTSIDSRSRLTVQLRQDILDQATHLYYERRRLKAELLLSPPKDEAEKLYKTLELQEVTANLDGLTNGYFSKFLQQEK